MEDKVSPKKRLKQIKGEIEALRTRMAALKDERKSIREELQSEKAEKPAS